MFLGVFFCDGFCLLVFGLNNEYMLTFYIDGIIYDRKYIFVPDSVVEENLIQIPLIDRPGILIR